MFWVCKRNLSYRRFIHTHETYAWYGKTENYYFGVLNTLCLKPYNSNYQNLNILKLLVQRTSNLGDLTGVLNAEMHSLQAAIHYDQRSM